MTTGAVEHDLLGVGVKLQEGRNRVADGQRRPANGLAQVAGAHEVAALGRQRLHQGAMSSSRVLELVHLYEREPVRERPANVGPLTKQTLQLDYQVARVQAPAVAQDAIVVRVKLRELPLALGSDPLGSPLRLPLALLGPVAQAAGGDPLGLQRIDAPQEPGEKSR